MDPPSVGLMRSGSYLSRKWVEANKKVTDIYGTPESLSSLILERKAGR